MAAPSKIGRTSPPAGTVEMLPETDHRLFVGDAREMPFLIDRSIHLVVTSPPYWTLKEYRMAEGQLGLIEDYESFQAELAQVWTECFRVLVPGGRLIVNVGDVCLPRRKAGRHHVMPLHADIAVRCRRIGFDYLAPIFWYKLGNLKTEVNRPGGSWFLGKPFEPNGIIKNEVEFILMLRKPGAYRSPTDEQRMRSRINREDYFRWYRQVWDDIPGASTKEHPAPFPLELINRLVRMFSFVDDVVLDPFVGTGTTMLAAALAGRHSVAYEIEPSYARIASKRFEMQIANRGPKLHLVESHGLQPFSNAGLLRASLS